MRVMVLGSGGREHAICDAISRSDKLTKLWCAPGNAGIAEVAECVSLEATDVIGLSKFVRAHQIDLVIPGSEASLSAGITNAMDKIGVACCGPTWEAAQLESSKLFTKNASLAANLPTASWKYFTDSRSARDHVSRLDTWPIVIKADGLAAGKGVSIVYSANEAYEIIAEVMDRRIFGDAGSTILIEEYLEGEEVSFFCLCNGEQAMPFGAAQDHKRIGERDTGLNTGGMGAYSPPPVFTTEMQDEVLRTIVQPTLRYMKERGTPFRGILFVGLMLTAEGPRLIEFNVRFGDPECQTLLMLLESDLLDALHRTATGNLNDLVLQWKPQHAMTVVMSSPGYPESPQTGSVIRIDALPTGVKVFHAGTAMCDGKLVASGGRVLNVCATGPTLADARIIVYAGISAIDWPEGYFRRDIGWRALER